MNTTLPPGSVVSLLPATDAFSWWQLLLAPAALAVLLLLPRPEGVTPTSSPKQPSLFHLFRAKTSHARYLPALSKHIFSYPVLYFGFDLDAVESGALDLGRAFGYRPSKWSLTGLRPGGYLGKAGGKERSIRDKLNELMIKEGVPVEDVGKVYSVTMPEYCGVQGINPLTVHFGYKVGADGGTDVSSSLELKVVVLEVHNTFGETHAYLLRTGVDEDDKVALGFDHQFTFPRAFHVSPFNDRTGFYRVAIVDPLGSNPLSPTLNIRIIFLTPQMEKKIYADLAGTGTPLTRSTLLRSLARWPLSLFLTLPRILYQAGRLHFGKRLDVFPRPEPYIRLPGDEDGEEVRGEEVAAEDEVVNPVEGGGKAGGLGWQAEGGADKRARETVAAFVQRRVDEMWSEEGRRVRVIFQPADSAVDTTDIGPNAAGATQPTNPAGFKTGGSPAPPLETLRVFYLTPLFFSDLVACPTARLAYELGSLTERRWRANSPALFLDLFRSPPAPPAYPLSTRVARRLRLHTIRWALGFAPGDSPSPLPVGSRVWPAHPLDDAGGDWGMAGTLLGQVVALKLSYWVFVLVGARFVKGMETWGEWARWAERKAREEAGAAAGVEAKAKVEFGSVRREEGDA